MASTAQVGQGIGSVLGLFLGHRAGASQAKKRRKAKADLDEKELQKARDKESRAARLKVFLGGDLAPEQEQSFLSGIGIKPTTEQNLFGDIGREGFTPGTDEEKIFREEMDKRKRLGQLKKFGVDFRKAAGEGAVDLSGIGLQRTPGDIADVGLTEAKIKTQESIQSVNKARVKSFDALAAARKRNTSTSGKKSEKRLALNNLQSALLKEIKLLDAIIDDDPLSLNPETEIEQRRRNELTNELIEIRKELRSIGGVKETKIPKRVKQSDVNKMSIDELFGVLTEK